VDILVKIGPGVYKAHVTKDKKGMAQSLVQCQNAVHGTMVASLLHCCKFAKSLTDVNFVIDPHGPCVVISWQVDDLKASHVKVRVMNSVIRCLRWQHKSMFEDGLGAMAVSQGKVHKHLGMTLDFSVRGEVKISMFDHVEETLTAFFWWSGTEW
jgi:hypothetical protein